MAHRNEPLESVRLDRWLFAVRVFRSRSLAVQAISSGRIKIGGDTVKPHRPVRVGDLIDYRDQGRTLRYEAVKLIEKRVGAKDARACYVLTEDPDLTEDVREMVKLVREMDRQTPRVRGKPTKKDRRDIRKLKEGDL